MGKDADTRGDGYDARRYRRVPGTTTQTLLAQTRVTPTRHSQRGENLHPDRDHSEKKGDRSECGGFLHNGTKHDLLPRTNIEHSSTFVLDQVIYSGVQKSPFWRHLAANLFCSSGLVTVLMKTCAGGNCPG